MDRSVQERKVQTGYAAHVEAQTHEIQNTESRADHNIWMAECRLTSVSCNVYSAVYVTSSIGQCGNTTRLDILRGMLSFHSN